MNILIPNSWLKEYLETNATPQQFATAMSLTSVSIERINEVDGDYVFDIEVTTNRPDLMSVIGIAREASAVLPEAGFKAVFKNSKSELKLPVVAKSPHVIIKNDPSLVNRVTAVVMEVIIKPSPKLISERLEKTDIRSINNVIDVTNYIMRETGHPVHAFDYDRLADHALIIRASKKGEKITTLDGQEYTLPGGDIVAEDGAGRLVDLMGIMGLENSSITQDTKRVLLFLDNNNPQLLRKTSMSLGIRTEAAILNEKGVDPELMMPTLLRGIELLEKMANGKVISDIIDLYPNKPQDKKITVPLDLINRLVGVDIPSKTVVSILKNLGFEVLKNDGKAITIGIPSTRYDDIEIAEDIVEEVARVYGYHKIPNSLPAITSAAYYHQEVDEYYWIKKIKEAFKYWGFNETYTYSMVGESLFDGPTAKAVKLRNPLDEDHVYLRNALIPSLIEVSNENKARESIRLFELSNVYLKKTSGLPDETLHLAALIKEGGASFLECKGIVERVFEMLGIGAYSFAKKNDGIEGAVIKVGSTSVGVIEYDVDLVAFELNISALLQQASSQKVYKAPSKFPPVIEDIRVVATGRFTYAEMAQAIKGVDQLIYSVRLLDTYEDKMTFRITYLSYSKNLTNEIIIPIRESVAALLKSKFKAVIG